MKQGSFYPGSSGFGRYVSCMESDLWRPFTECDLDSVGGKKKRDLRERALVAP